MSTERRVEQPVTLGVPDKQEIWTARVAAAVKRIGTPCYVSAWQPVAAAAARFDAINTSVPLELWLSFKTHPVIPLAQSWLDSGRGVEVVSEAELLTVRDLGATADQILVNGIAKHAWLHRHPIPRLQVHFDSLGEIERLLPLAIAQQWRVGIRCHVPGEADARAPEFGGQFGLSRDEALIAIQQLGAAGADLHSVHFHLGQGRRQPDAAMTALTFVADLCDEACFAPRIVDCGGGLPASEAEDASAAFDDLAAAIHVAPSYFPALSAIWLENGRGITESSAVLAVRVIEVKERADCRYLICDGGRTNQALAADGHPHPIAIPAARCGRRRLTTICGPTCMTDDRLGRWELPEDLQVGDVIVWQDAGAYHLPWETRFSHGHCPVAWFDADEELSIAREREQPRAWAAAWLVHSHG